MIVGWVGGAPSPLTEIEGWRVPGRSQLGQFHRFAQQGFRTVVGDGGARRAGRADADTAA